MDLKVCVGAKQRHNHSGQRLSIQTNFLFPIGIPSPPHLFSICGTTHTPMRVISMASCDLDAAQVRVGPGAAHTDYRFTFECWGQFAQVSGDCTFLITVAAATYPSCLGWHSEDPGGARDEELGNFYEWGHSRQCLHGVSSETPCRCYNWV